MTNAAFCVIFLTALKQEEYFYGTKDIQIDVYIPQKKKTTDIVVACLHCAINCEPSNLSEIFYILIIG